METAVTTTCIKHTNKLIWVVIVNWDIWQPAKLQQLHENLTAMLQYPSGLSLMWDTFIWMIFDPEPEYENTTAFVFRKQWSEYSTGWNSMPNEFLNVNSHFTNTMDKFTHVHVGFFTGSIARSANLPVFNILRGRFRGFSPRRGDTLHWWGWNLAWRSPPCQISPPPVQRQGCRTPKIEIFTQISPKCGI